MSGDEELSPAQQELLSQFKQNIKDLLKPEYDDNYLLRWLRARWWDLKKAEDMIRSSLAWRAREHVDTILDDWIAPDVLTAYFPGGMPCYDREGCPVWTDLVGYSDLKGLLNSAKKQDIIRFKVQHCEFLDRECKRQSQKLGKRIDKVILIHDMDQFGLKHLWKPGMDVLVEILGLIEANYPETLKVCYVINAPKIFPIAYNIIKPFLNEDTKKKIQICGSNWKSKLLEQISPSELPVHWGGNATDPDGDPFCRSKVCLGGTVPQSFYLRDNFDYDQHSFTEVTVGRASSVKLEYDVTLPGSALRWQFLTDQYDIGFGVFHKTDASQHHSSEMEKVLHTERYNSHMVPEDGMITVQTPGIYVVRFDNTYSWVNSKKVRYLVEVLGPDEEEEFYDATEGETNCL